MEPFDRTIILEPADLGAEPDRSRMTASTRFSPSDSIAAMLLKERMSMFPQNLIAR
jgi:hypothetical protein